jgi:hypothetical protein
LIWLMRGRREGRGLENRAQRHVSSAAISFLRTQISALNAAKGRRKERCDNAQLDLGLFDKLVSVYESHVKKDKTAKK